MDGSIRATLAGFIGALVVLAILFGVIGIGRILAALSRADPFIVAIIPLAVVVWLVAWGLLLRVVIGVLDGRLSVVSSVLIYTAALFANNITPFGQAGGEPVSAYLIANATDSEYETGLAAITSVDAIHFVPSLSLAAFGLAALAATAALSQHLQFAAMAVVGIAVLILIVVLAVWRFRTRTEAVVTRVVTAVVRTIGRVIPRYDPPDQETIVVRVDGFFVALERVATDRKSLALAFSFATAGWIALTGILWLSLFALGHAVPITTLLFVVPLGSVASVAPLPGGLGGIESVLIPLLVTFTGVDPATASAAVVLHRTASYGLPTLVGGVVASILGVQSRTMLETDPSVTADSESESESR